MGTTAELKPTSASIRQQILRLSVISVAFQVSSYLPGFFGRDVLVAKLYSNGSSRTNLGYRQPSLPVDPWSASDLIAHNVSSMFALAPESWTSTSDIMEQQCPFNLSFFVYDNLPNNLTTTLEDYIRLLAHKGERVQENVGTEWALVQLFRTSPCRTYNASQADYFVVPYMHYSHCYFHDGYWYQCGHIQPKEFDPLFESLEYYREKPDKHIFIQANTSPMLNKRIRKGPHIKLMADRVSSHIKTTAFTVPLFHDAPNFQPSQILNQPESYWTRPRKYAFSSFYGARNPNMGKGAGARRFREYFFNSIQEYYNETIAGMPYVAVQLTDAKTTRTTRLNPMEIYQESALCPVLAGDCCWSRRFFDVIRNGCLPVVLEWEMPNGKGQTWHTPSDHCPLEDSYPFFPQNSQIGNSDIDYDSFVVKAPGNPDNETDVSSLYKAMQAILQDPEELARRQRIMMSYAPLFTFGLGKEAHQHHDAFWKVLQLLEQQQAQGRPSGLM